MHVVFVTRAAQSGVSIHLEEGLDMRGEHVSRGHRVVPCRGAVDTVLSGVRARVDVFDGRHLQHSLLFVGAGCLSVTGPPATAVRHCHWQRCHGAALIHVRLVHCI